MDSGFSAWRQRDIDNHAPTRGIGCFPLGEISNYSYKVILHFYSLETFLMKLSVNGKSHTLDVEPEMPLAVGTCAMNSISKAPNMVVALPCADACTVYCLTASLYALALTPYLCCRTTSGQHRRFGRQR
jgi:hypothetical protein